MLDVHIFILTHVSRNSTKTLVGPQSVLTLEGRAWLLYRIAVPGGRDSKLEDMDWAPVFPLLAGIKLTLFMVPVYLLCSRPWKGHLVRLYHNAGTILSCCEHCFDWTLTSGNSYGF